MKLAWDHWHVELSSVCALRCPRCPRAEVPDTLLNRQLSLEFFQQRIGAEAVRHIRKFTFCGNDGDPIYCRDLTAILSWIKSVNPQIQIAIITNGSHRPAAWWQQLAQVLDHRDEIHWSLDGWDQASNQQYRQGSDWESIIQGIEAFRAANTNTYLIWATIAFSFNQDCFDRQQSLARNLGFDLFQITKSTKFHHKYPGAYASPDPLEPRSEWLASGDRFERVSREITARDRPGHELRTVFWQRAQDIAQSQQHPALCGVGNKGVFVNSRGEFYPCCWTANRYPHNQDWHQRAAGQFNLNDRSWSDIINDAFWHTEFLVQPGLECVTKCTESRLKDREHVTEW